MSTQTTTIRVSVRTRDRLAAQAREHGVSIAALLTELAARAEREAIFRAERDATRAEAATQAVRQENIDWDTTVSDGFA
jgi:post-segregation antitoxin (ccd killing protein)